MEKEKQLCSNCKTGEKSYKLDPQSVFCPYIHMHKSSGCKMYVPIKEGAKK